MAGLDSLENPQLEKINLRSCGRAAAPRQPPPRLSLKRERSAPSIPTRLETTLCPGARETLAFGSRAVRMEDQVDLEVPGPGNYTGAKSFLQESDENVSWGRRGMGGFASRSQRFGARSLPSLPRPGRGCPGPGAYDPQSALQNLREPAALRGLQSSAFAASGRSGHRYAQATPIPGPGDYEAPMPDEPHVSAASGAFRSGTRRSADTVTGAAAGTASIPGPGEYTIGGSASLASMAAAMQEHAIFKEPSRRRIARVHRDLPPADERARQLLGAFGDQVGRECVGASGTFVQPGPGHYEKERCVDPSEPVDAFQAVASSSFVPGTRRPDPAPKHMLDLPGPDAYDAKRLDAGRLTSAQSVFNSASQRLNPPPAPAPGPAYYSPAPPKVGKSFMLNIKKEWRG